MSPTMPLQEIDPAIAVIAIGITVKAKTLGLPVPLELNTLELDTEGFQRVLEVLANFGFRTTIPSDQLFEYSPAKIMEELERLELDFEQRPLPDFDLRTLNKVFPLAQLGNLLGIAGDIKQYLENASLMPSSSQYRAHFLAMIISDLTGSYSESGIQKWFNRKRSKLGGIAPLDVLVGDWKPEDEKPKEVRRLAASLVSLGAT